MLIINARLCDSDHVRREIAAVASSGTTELVAVLDAPDRELMDAMLHAGMHVVLVKPIHVNDLERLLSQP